MNKTWLYAPVAMAILMVSQGLLAEGPIAWVVPSTLERVTRTQKPGTQTGVAICAARGEYQSFQIAVQAPAGGLTNVNFSVSELVMPKTGARIPQKNVVLYREKYMTVLAHSPTWNGPPNLPITNIDTFPDALIPFIDPATGKPPSGGTYIAAPLSLTADHNAVFWVDVLVPRNAKAGQYKGTYTVSSGQGSASGHITVNVWNFTLPRERISNPRSMEAA